MDGELPPWSKFGNHNSNVSCDTAAEHQEDQGNRTSVTEDALELSNGVELEQTSSKDVRAPEMDLYKGPDIEATNDNFRIAESKQIKNQDGQKGEPDPFISELSEDISTRKDILEMGKNRKPNSTDVGSSVGKEELGLTVIREHDAQLSPDSNRNLYAPFSSSDRKCKTISSVEPTLQMTKGCEKQCKDVSPRKHSKVINKTVDGNTSDGLHHIDPQKNTDGTASVKSLDHSSGHDVQDQKDNICNVVACLPNPQDQNTALGKYEGSKEGTSQSINTNSAEIDLKVEAKFAPEIQNSSEAVPDQPMELNKSHTDFKCKDSQKEQRENDCLQENNAKKLDLTSTPERTPDECETAVQEKQTLKSPSGAKGRKRKKTELELLFEPIYNTKKDVRPVYESDIPDATEEANKNISLPDQDSSVLKEEDLVANPPSSKRKSCQQRSQLELVTDTAETSGKPGRSCSEATQEKAQLSARINTEAGSKTKGKKGKRIHLKAKNSAPGMDCASLSQLCNTSFVNEGSNVAVTHDSISSLESSFAESSTAETEAKSPVVFSTPKKSMKRKNVSNQLPSPCLESTNTTEADASIVQPTVRRFRARKAPDIVNLEPAHLSELVSTAESVCAEESDCSGVQQQKTKKTPTKRQKTTYTEAQTSPSEDLASTVVVMKKKTAKQKIISRNKMNDLNKILVENPSLLSAEIQQHSVSKTKKGKVATKIKQEAEEILVKQHDDLIAIPSIPGASMDTFDSQMALKEKSRIKKAVRQNLVPVYFNEHVSTAEKVFAEESACLGVKQQKTKKTPSNRKKTKNKYMEAQTSPSEDLASTAVVKKTAKRNKMNDYDLNSILVENPSSLSAEIQAHSATRIKQEEEELLDNQPYDVIALTSTPGASIDSFHSQVALKGKSPVKKAVRQNVTKKHRQTSSATLKHKESPHSTSRKSMSKIKVEPIDDQTIQQEIHPFDPIGATEIDRLDGDNQKKTKRPAKRANNSNSRSEDNNKCIKKRRTIRNVPAVDPAEHPSISSGKDVTQSSCIDTFGNVENQVFITTEISPQSSQKKAKKTSRKQLFEQKGMSERRNVLEQDKMTDHKSGLIRKTDGEEKNIFFSKQPDGQTVRSQQCVNDVVDHMEETRTTVQKVAKSPKKKCRKSVQKTMEALLNQTVKEEEIESIYESHTELEETLSSSMQTTDCEDQNYVTQKRKRGRPPLNKSIKECNTSLGESPMHVINCEAQENVQKPRKRGRPSLNESTAISDITLSNSMQTFDCEGQNIVKPIKRKRGRPLKNKKQISLAHLKDYTSPSQDNPGYTVKAEEEDNNLTAFEESWTNLGTTDPLSHSSSSPNHKNRKTFKKPKKNVTSPSKTPETSDFHKADMHFLPQNSTDVCSDEGKTSMSLPEVADNLKRFENTSIQDRNVLKDIKTENEVVKRKKYCQKRRTSKEPSVDQSLTSKAEMQDCCKPGVTNEHTEKNSVEMNPEKLYLAKNCKKKHSAVQSANTSKRNKRLPTRSKPKAIVKKPLTCKYCGISFRHITAYTIHQRIHTGDKPYKCKICGKTFAQLSKLKSHRNVHEQDTSFPCPCCNRRFLRKENLLRHFEAHLQESKANREAQDIKRNANKYRCLICKENFVNQAKFQNHMQTHETEKALCCKDCGKKFWTQSSLAAHEKKHWPVKPYACSICGKGFNLLKALKKHSEDHVGEAPFSCFHCGHAFSDLPALRMHQAYKTCITRKKDSVEGFIVSQGVDGQVNTPVFFRCQICKQLFRKWCQYTLHLQMHTSSPPYICFACGQCYAKDFKTNVHCVVCCQSSGEEKNCGASLSEIMRGVPKTYPAKSLPVPSSSKRLSKPGQTKDKSSVKLPINSTSTSSSQEYVEITQSLWKFKCSRCGQRFKEYKSLGVHLQTHAPGFRYTCTHCGQFFERWSKLWLHQRHHSLKRHRYSCNQCNLQFRFYRSFKEHMIDHTGQGVYVCTLCPQTFIQEASLHAHQCESHKLRKSLKCDVCSKTFSSLPNLIKHSFLHNGSTSHICLSCNLPFTNSRLLKEHLKTHTTEPGPTLPDIPLKPLSFPHKCKRCKASFSTGDLLYAHQICHSRDAKTQVHPAAASTSKSSDPNKTPSAQKNHISDLKLDSIPNDDSLYRYSHPDNLYISPSHKVQPPVINLDPDEQEASESQSTPSEFPNGELNSQSDSINSQNGHPELPNGELTSQSDRTASDSRNAHPELPNNEITSQSNSTAIDSQNARLELPSGKIMVSDSLSTRPKLPNRELTSQPDSTQLPQATSDQETTNQNLSESIQEMTDEMDDCSRMYKTRSTVARTNVDMNLETLVQQSSEESFECADCTEKLTSVLSLYEHYILHALGDTLIT